MRKYFLYQLTWNTNEIDNCRFLAVSQNFTWGVCLLKLPLECASLLTSKTEVNTKIWYNIMFFYGFALLFIYLFIWQWGCYLLERKMRAFFQLSSCSIKNISCMRKGKKNNSNTTELGKLPLVNTRSAALSYM